MSAQGVLNYPNGVRQVFTARMEDVGAISVDIKFTNPVTSESFDRLGVEPRASFPYALEYPYGYNQIEVTYGAVVETFDVSDMGSSTIILVYDLNGAAGILHFDVTPEWVGGAFFVNVYPSTALTVETEKGVLEYTANLAADGGTALIENPAGLPLVARDDLSNWAFHNTPGTSMTVRYYSGAGIPPDLYRSVVYFPDPRSASLTLFYDDGSTTSPGFEAIRLFITSFPDALSWRWQYFEPALPY